MARAPRPAPQLLMCRPTHYTIAYEINPWMSLRRQVRRHTALRQWNALHHLLTRTLGVRVRLLPAQPNLPDLVFTANAGLMAGGRLIRSNFRYPERQGEEPVIERYARRLGCQVIRLPRPLTFEGEGDALWMGETLVYGFRFRSDAPVHEHLSRILRKRVLPVELSDKRFYHLDTCFCPVDAQTALWFPRAFDRYGRRVIESLVRDPIAVSEADARRFTCNAIVIGRAVVLQDGFSSALRRQLLRRDLQAHPVELSEFLKAGGSAKCLVLRLSG